MALNFMGSFDEIIAMVVVMTLTDMAASDLILLLMALYTSAEVWGFSRARELFSLYHHWWQLTPNSSFGVGVCPESVFRDSFHSCKTHEISNHLG